MRSESVAIGEPVGLSSSGTKRFTGVLKEFQVGRRRVILWRNEREFEMFCGSQLR